MLMFLLLAYRAGKLDHCIFKGVTDARGNLFTQSSLSDKPWRNLVKQETFKNFLMGKSAFGCRHSPLPILLLMSR